jgi:hypothetical protein
MKSQDGASGFKKFVSSDRNRQDLLLSATDALVAGTLVSIAGLTFGIGFVTLAGIVTLATGLVLFMKLSSSFGLRTSSRPANKPA